MRHIHQLQLHTFLPQERWWVRGYPRRPASNLVFRENSACAPIQPESQPIELLLQGGFIVVGKEELAKARTRGKGDDGGNTPGWSRDEKTFSCASVDDVEEDTDDPRHNQDESKGMGR